jgi:hypothetical protein
MPGNHNFVDLLAGSPLDYSVPRKSRTGHYYPPKPLSVEHSMVPGPEPEVLPQALLAKG